MNGSLGSAEMGWSVSLCSSGPAPSACPCWRWRTWWSWGTSRTPSVSSPMYSLWLTTCAGTRCPWVGRATSDLRPSPSALRNAVTGHMISRLQWTSWGVCVCICARVCARLPVCFLSLSPWWRISLSCVSVVLWTQGPLFSTVLTFSSFEFCSFYILQLIKLRSRWLLHLPSLTQQEKRNIWRFPLFNLFVPPILYATLVIFTKSGTFFSNLGCLKSFL